MWARDGTLHLHACRDLPAVRISALIRPCQLCGQLTGELVSRVGTCTTGLAFVDIYFHSAALQMVTAYEGCVA